jgi:hypothetical protein
MPAKTTTWFGNTTEPPNSRSSPQYALTNTVPVPSDQSVLVSLVEVVVETIESQDGQTSLNLYVYVNPYALEEIIDASATKKSDVEVRFTFDDHLIVVRSNNTILIYEPLEKQHEENQYRTPTP